MANEEKEQPETLLKDLIEKVEKDDLPTNVFDVEGTDPLVLLGKMNEIIKNLKLFASLVSESDEQSTEALEKAVKALAEAGEALEKANETSETALKAFDKAEVADSTAVEALHDASNAIQKAGEALTKANEALEAVTEKQGTKVFDTSSNLLKNAHFEGTKGVDVKMSETDPESFEIGLDEATKATIESNKQRLDENDENIENLTNMLSVTEELAQKATEDIANTINPKLTELETSKVSKSHTNSYGDVFTLEYDKYEQNLDIKWKSGSATWTLNVNRHGYTFLYGNIEIFKIDLSNVSYRGRPLAQFYNWQSVDISSSVKSKGKHSIDLATALTDWVNGAEYEAVVVIEAYCQSTAFMITTTDMVANSKSDQRFSTYGRQGGGIYTLPLKRYLYWEIISSALDTFYITITAIRRTK